MDFILALDQGTTSSRAILFDRHGQVHSLALQEFPQIFPQNGWVEHDPQTLWNTQLAVARQVLSQSNTAPNQIAALGITNQRETTLLWDRRTGQPIYNAIVWQDRRTAEFCQQLQQAGHLESIQQKTGLVLDAYFSASKIRWILDHVPHARQQADRGQLAFGTVDTWLLWNLTRGQLHATDPSNASRTLLYNLHTHQWDDDLLALFDIPRSLLPDIQPSSQILASTAPDIFSSPIPIAALIGDQQAALCGQSCFTPGLAKNTYGTGCFMLLNTGSTPVISQHKLLTTVAWQIPSVPHPLITYALEGSVFAAGAVVQWLRDGLGLIPSAAAIEPLAASVPDSAGVYLVPAFAGLGAPHWDPYARGTILGLTRATTSAHLARAALEAIAFQVADILDAMQTDSALPICQLRADGAAATNNLLLQFQADLLQIPVVRPKITETTALGAAYLAGLATGFWKNQEALQAHWQIDQRFEPRLSKAQVAHRRHRWTQAVARSRNWEENS